MTSFINRLSKNFVCNFSSLDIQDTENPLPKRKAKLSPLAAILKADRAPRNEDPTKTTDLKRAYSLLHLDHVKLPKTKKLVFGVNSSINESLDTSGLIHKGSIILEKESVKLQQENLTKEEVSTFTRPAVPTLSLRKLSEGMESVVDSSVQSKTNVRSVSVSKQISLLKSETRVIKERFGSTQKDGNRSLIKWHKQEMNNSSHRITRDESLNIIKKGDYTERIQNVPKFVRQSKRKDSLINIGNIPNEEIFDVRPQIHRKIKAHKLSMLSFVKQDVQESKRSFDAEEEERKPVEKVVPGKKPNILMNSVSQPFSVIMQSGRKDKKANLILRYSKGEDRISQRNPYNLDAENERHHNESGCGFLKISGSSEKKSPRRSSSRERTRENSLEKKAKSGQSIELSCFKMKSKRKDSNPFFFDESWEAGEEDPKPQTIKATPKSPETKKKLREKLLTCLRKMKKLKLSPKEIYENKDIFSQNPFERECSRDLINAARKGDLFELKLLLKQNSKYLVYDFDHVYQTALHWAAKKDHDDIARVLIEHGADVDAKDFARRTPLYFAIKHNSIATLKVLLANHAELWSCEGETYKELSKHNDSAWYYIKKAQQLNILMRMHPPNHRDDFWRREALKVILGAEFRTNDIEVRIMFEKYLAETEFQT